MKIIFDNDATMTDYEKFIERYAVPNKCIFRPIVLNERYILKTNKGIL